jgi:hypothetical protein
VVPEAIPIRASRVHEDKAASLAFYRASERCDHCYHVMSPSLVDVHKRVVHNVLHHLEHTIHRQGHPAA